MRTYHSLGLLVATALLGAACNPTYAPPVRGVQYGAPARLQQGHVEIGGTAGGVVVPNVGGPHVAIGVTDWFAVEAGGNFSYDEWSIGFVGTRFSFSGDRRRRAYLIGDLELGAGAGLGGQLDGNRDKLDCNYCDGLKAVERIAYGGYQGAGLGVRIRWFSIFGRVRLEESRATNVPLTLWPSASVGMEFRVHDKVALGLASGVMGYSNSRDSAVGWFYQLGITIFLDQRTPPPPPAVEPYTPYPVRYVPAPLPPPPPPPPAAAPWAPRPPLTPVPAPPVTDPFDDDATYD
jgi:hypothetical protein